MRFVAGAACVFAVVGAVPAVARPREQIVDYRQGQLVGLRAVIGHPLTLRFAPGEKVTGATISDPTGWEAEPNRSGSRLVVKARSTGGAATMAVVTDRRSYTFTLSVAPEREKTTLPIAVRVQPATIGQLAPFQTAGNFASERTFYEIRGAAELRPSSVTEDGVRTFIDWPADAALPAVYALDTAGRESLTNGNMRNGRFVIDSVEKHLIFRLDKRAATAVRVLSRSARK